MSEGDHWTKGSKKCCVIYAYQTREESERDTAKLVLCKCGDRRGRTSENKMGVRGGGGGGGGKSVVGCEVVQL